MYSGHLKNILKGLSAEDQNLIAQSVFDNLELANVLIENAVGYYHLPFALAPGFAVNERFYPGIPLVTEETSVVAALSKNILFINTGSKITASQDSAGVLGQIHFPRLKNPQHFCACIQAHRVMCVQAAHQGPLLRMVQRGGGIEQITSRLIQRPDGATLGVVHIEINTKEAMGANVVTQTCEYLKRLLEELCHEEALMGIISNHNPQKTIRVEIVLERVSASLAARIAEAALIAQCDPYRAVTHNKGLLNGMDALCLATGNDWRALEAGLHGFAAHGGTYRGLSQWFDEGSGRLRGVFCGPLNVGTVGGATHIHPMAALALRCLTVQTAQELAFVMGAVGLIQNFAALRALVTHGLTRGHMALHAQNLLKQTDVTTQEWPRALMALKAKLRKSGFINTHDAWDILAELRR